MRILLIEDNPGDAELVKKSLDAVSNVHQLETHNRLRDVVARPDLDRFDVILSDLSLPDSSGLNCVRKLKRVAPDASVIVLTSMANDTVALEAIKEGAQDYLVKGQLDGDRLGRSIRYAAQRQRMRVENDRLLGDLRDAKTLLENKNRRLECLCETAQQFVDNVSHDFRTPLTVIMEYASLMRDGICGEVNAEQRRLLDVIDDRACDLNTMVDDMLDVSKLESGLLGASRRECHVQDIVEHVLPSLQRKAEVRDVALDIVIPTDLPPVYCDDEKVGRVIVNLVVNAIKFSRDPGAVQLWAERAGDWEVRVGVTDNGPGIPAERLEEIFTRFSQLHAEVQQSTKGFGLGLNIAQELVGLNLGRMGVDSEPDVGSTFTFTLPHANPTEVTRRYLGWLDTSSDASDAVSVIHIGMRECGASASRRDMDAFLGCVLRQKDLVFRRAERDWLLLVNTPDIELPDFRTRFEKEHHFLSRNRPRGPLPELTFDVEGSWSVPEEAGEILSRVAHYFPSLEACYA